jgi:hypothetical protein
MSIERGWSQTIVNTDLPIFHAIYLIPNKFKYAIGKALKIAIIGDIFDGSSQGTVQKRRLFVQKGHFQRLISWLCKLTLIRISAGTRDSDSVWISIEVKNLAPKTRIPKQN